MQEDAEALGCTAEVEERARRIVSQGTSAERQRAVYEAAGGAGNRDQALRAVVRELAAETVSALSRRARGGGGGRTS